MEMILNPLQQSLLEALLDQDGELSISLARQALADGMSPESFFEECIGPVMAEVGARFARLDLFLPEMVTAAEIVQEVNIQVIQPAIALSGTRAAVAAGKVLIATVQGDLHDIGKNMVAVMLSVNGFDVIDMGTDVAPTAIVETAIREKADIIGLSSLLTSCLPYMEDVVHLLESRGLRDQYAVIIGGAAPTPAYAERVKVNAQGHSAAEAVVICRELMKARSVA